MEHRAESTAAEKIHELALGLLNVVPIVDLAIERWFLLVQRRHTRRSVADAAFLALADEYRETLRFPAAGTGDAAS